MRFVKIIRLFMELHLHLLRRTHNHILLPLLIHRYLLIFTVFDVAAVAIVAAKGFSRVKLFKAMVIVLVYVVRFVKVSWLL